MSFRKEEVKMKFEPTPEYLLYPFGSNANEEKIKGQTKGAISHANLPMRVSYGYDDFLKICLELVKLGGHAKVVGMTGITQSRLNKISHGFA